jgi:Domain of unknown function (DUF4124)
MAQVAMEESPMFRTLLATALALALAPIAAQAQMYRCVDKNGNKHYSQTIPEACVGQMIEQLDSQGVVIRRIMPPPTPAERAAQEAAEQKKLEDAAAAKEQERRDKALLASYTSVQDIDDARARARAENDRMLAAINHRIAYLEKRHAREKKELQGYTGGKTPPEQLTMEIQNTESDLATQKQLLAAKQNEIDQIDARFAADRKRFVELTGGSASKQ